MCINTTTQVCLSMRLNAGLQTGTLGSSIVQRCLRECAGRVGGEDDRLCLGKQHKGNMEYGYLLLLPWKVCNGLITGVKIMVRAVTAAVVL